MTQSYMHAENGIHCDGIAFSNSVSDFKLSGCYADGTQVLIARQRVVVRAALVSTVNYQPIARASSAMYNA